MNRSDLSVIPLWAWFVIFGIMILAGIIGAFFEDCITKQIEREKKVIEYVEKKMEEEKKNAKKKNNNRTSA